MPSFLSEGYFFASLRRSDLGELARSDVLGLFLLRPRIVAHRRDVRVHGRELRLALFGRDGVVVGRVAAQLRLGELLLELRHLAAQRRDGVGRARRVALGRVVHVGSRRIGRRSGARHERRMRLLQLCVFFLERRKLALEQQRRGRGARRRVARCGATLRRRPLGTQGLQLAPERAHLVEPLAVLGELRLVPLAELDERAPLVELVAQRDALALALAQRRQLGGHFAVLFRDALEVRLDARELVLVQRRALRLLRELAAQRIDLACVGDERRVGGVGRRCRVVACVAGG